jgi:hypothetical protein
MRRHSICFAGTLWIAALVFLAPAGAQYPSSQYPAPYPSPYPSGGQYPPGTYPGQYPDNRMPGGIPVPAIHLPGKKSKDKPEQVHANLAGVEGTLRRLGEKELLLEIAKGSVLRFRLLASTKFENTSGQAMRDSLLHRGDRVSVQASAEDYGTAVRVVLVRAGSSGDRSAAEKPVDDSTVRVPTGSDFGKAKSVPVGSPSPGETAESGSASAPSASDTSGEAVAPPPESNSTDPARFTDARIIEDARAAAATFSSTLPNYLVQQVTTRSMATGFPMRWQEIDVITADLAYMNGKEDYRNFQSDGKPINAPENSGPWSTGEFGTTLEDVMSPLTGASFKRRGEETMAGRQAVIFDYKVEQPKSNWAIVSPDGRRYKPAYQGAVWIDRDSRRVRRLEQKSGALPAGYPINRAECTLQYGWVRIEQKVFLLPLAAEDLGCMSGSGTCTRNKIEFKNYRKFTVESNVNFGK